MRLVVIEDAKKTYRVYDGENFIAEYMSDGVLSAEQVEEIRVNEPPPLESA